ncbi:hypothetical protein P692DRAFT_20706443, partial [Suillus brevipes Sb2]
GPQGLEPDLDDCLTDDENFTHPQHSGGDSGISAEGRNEHGDPLPLDVDEEVLMNENAKLDDPGIGLSADSLARLRNPLQCTPSLDDPVMKAAVKTYMNLQHSDHDYVSQRETIMELTGEDFPSLYTI